MTDFTRELEAAREHVDVDWTEAREAKVRSAMHERGRARRARAVRLMAAASAAVVIAVLGLAWRHWAPKPVLQQASVAPAPRDLTLRLDDGSTIAARDDSTAMVLRQVAPDHVVLGLDKGSVRLDVVGRADRLVTVDARVARVETNAGVVAVELDGERVHVSVERGRVRILWGIEETWLQGGESGDFPRAAAAPVATSDVPAPSQAIPPVASAHEGSAVVGPASPASAWRMQARDGDYDRAFATLQTAGTAAVRDEAADLLLSADVARLSHHPADALEPLRRVVRDHAGDPRAPLAAFTLGRVLLDELGRPGEAAAAFEQARTLGSGGPLEEDALAREVEAWSRAGDAGRAHAAAERYVRLYPDGRRMRAVRKFGDVE